MKFAFIAVDLQNDFASKGGKHYAPRQAIAFLRKKLFSYCRKHGIKINEIISDYRQPRPGDRDESCVPGTWGYESIIPKALVKSRWIKCMNSPIWVRKNIGNPDKQPGLPYQDPQKFNKWLEETIGKPGKAIPVVFGLTIDCCVMSTIQELSCRGYYPRVLAEGVDHYSGDLKDKEDVLRTTVSNWSEVISWNELQKKLDNS